jgi:hypothetical protein
MEGLEPLNGVDPLDELGRHPDGRQVAMRTGWDAEGRGERAAVWDTRTGKITWAPEGAVAIAWLRGGSELLVVIDETLHRLTWPEKEPLAACEVPRRGGEGWIDRIVVDRQDRLAAVRWLDQTEAGFELVDLRGRGTKHLKRSGYRVAGTNLLDGPVFSPTGRFLVSTEGIDEWWTEGSRAGRVTIFDTRDSSTRHADVELDVPAGWEPGTMEAQAGLIGVPTFVNARAFVLKLPTGEKRRYTT